MAGSTNPTQRLLRRLNRLFSKRNEYFECVTRSPSDGFEYSFRSGEVVYNQFHGYNDFTGKIVLDFGCGRGGKTVYYATRGPQHVIGVDVENDQSEARDWARRRGLDVTFITLRRDGSIRLPDRFCDVVINSSVLEHVADPGATFAELSRVLKPGGLLLNRWHPYRTRYGAHLGAALRIPFAHHVFSEAALVRAYHDRVVERFGDVPAILGPVNARSRSFSDLAFHLNRVTVRQMRLALHSAGLALLERRFLRNTRELASARLIPERIVDYFIDYEVQICRIAATPMRMTTRRRRMMRFAIPAIGGGVHEPNIPQPV